MAVTAVVAGAAVSAGAGIYSANKQAKTARKAQRAGDRIQDKQDFYNDMLMELIDNPASIKEDPGYQFSFDQGLQAVERSSAARGFTGSGNAAISLLRYGEEFSSKFLKQREDLLAGLSGANQSASPAYGVAATANQSSTDILSSTLASLGYTFGKGGVGRTGSTAGASAGTPAAEGNFDPSMGDL